MNVLITGAGGNLGAACVNHFVAKGWNVLALVSPGKVPDSSIHALHYEGVDLLDESRLFDWLTGTFPPIDLAILTVGGFEAGGIEKADDEALHRMSSLNFETAYNIARPLFMAMNKQETGGRIVFIGARPALDAAAGKGLIAYGLSKSLLFKLADYLNASSEKVRCHVVVFTALDTPQNRKSMPNADRSKWVAPRAVAIQIEKAFSESQRDTIIEVV